MTNRAPILCPGNPKYRMVSVPNGLWQAQHYVGILPDSGTRENDPWVAIARPTSFSVAEGQMIAAAEGQKGVLV